MEGVHGFGIRLVSPSGDAAAYVLSVSDAPKFVTSAQLANTDDEGERFLTAAAPWAIYDEATGETAGFVGIYPDPFTATLYWSVVPQWRRRGAATRGAELVVERAIGDEIAVYLGINAHHENVASHRIAEHLGFERQADRERVFAGGLAPERHYRLKL